MKTHNVCWLGYLPEEGQEVYCGSLAECEEYVSKSSTPFMYEIRPMSEQEIIFENQ